MFTIESRIRLLINLLKCNLFKIIKIKNIINTLISRQISEVQICKSLHCEEETERRLISMLNQTE